MHTRKGRDGYGAEIAGAWRTSSEKMYVVNVEVEEVEVTVDINRARAAEGNESSTRQGGGYDCMNMAVGEGVEEPSLYTTTTNT
jgi:hypothetical protein